MNSLRILESARILQELGLLLWLEKLLWGKETRSVTAHAFVLWTYSRGDGSFWQAAVFLSLRIPAAQPRACHRIGSVCGINCWMMNMLPFSVYWNGIIKSSLSLFFSKLNSPYYFNLSQSILSRHHLPSLMYLYVLKCFFLPRFKGRRSFWGRFTNWHSYSTGYA